MGKFKALLTLGVLGAAVAFAPSISGTSNQANAQVGFRLNLGGASIGYGTPGYYQSYRPYYRGGYYGGGYGGYYNYGYRPYGGYYARPRYYGRNYYRPNRGYRRYYRW